MSPGHCLSSLAQLAALCRRKRLQHLTVTVLDPVQAAQVFNRVPQANFANSTAVAVFLD